MEYLVTVRTQDSLRTRICGKKKTTQGGLNSKEAILKALPLTTCNKQTFFRAVIKHTSHYNNERKEQVT